MATELKIPEVGESITEVEIGDWRKQPGDAVQKDEMVVVIESEKATVELPSPVEGTLGEILKPKGATAKVGEVIARIEETGKPRTEKAEAKAAAKPAKAEKVAHPPEEQPHVMPAAQRVLAEKQLKPSQVQGTGPGGRILKEDALRPAASESGSTAALSGGVPSGEAVPKDGGPPPRHGKPARISESQTSAGPAGSRQEEVVPMTRLRRTIAERLVQAQQNAALLTTFNEIDMSAVMQLRKEYGETFLQKHGAKLGFMSFFVKACVDALRLFPQVNAEVRGTDIVFHNYYDIGVAIGGGRGLVVPVLRNAERMSFAEIERAIVDLATRAKENKLKVEELHGGTFTISNGGVYGSLLSTPIVNPPQSGILGLHAIQDRPVAREGQVVIRPMMYIALTYDHRIVDGREAVTFLKRIKDVIESPARILLET
ncbi:MAG: 2-oxoglutarate dehydrogenase complex dihydrolipoyllysine-residue succinyltransferase [Verrucomicrobiota bacterium]